jgi:hypothetical protein
MAEITVGPKQSLYNLAIQHYGTPEGLFDLLKRNSLDFDGVAEGSVLKVAESFEENGRLSETVKNYFKKKKLIVANIQRIEDYFTVRRYLKIQGSQYLKTSEHKDKIYLNG